MPSPGQLDRIEPIETLGPAARTDDAVARAPASLFGRLLDVMSSAGSLLIGAMMLLVCADVVARNALSRPITGVTELVALAIVAVLFLQLPAALRHGRLSRAEILIDGLRRRRPRIAARLQALLHACGAVFCAIVFQSTLAPFNQAWTTGDFIGVEGVFTAPTWPVTGIVLLGSAATTLQFLLLALSELRGVPTTGDPPP